jgi:Tfp pilus assembly protein PilO
MIKRILLLLILMELGVIGWFFQQSNHVEEDLGHGRPAEFNEGQLKSTGEEEEEPIVTPEKAKELLGMLPEMFNELLQFGQLQNDIIDSNLLQEIDKLQLEAGNSLDLNEEGYNKILKQFLDDPENKETLDVYYKWLKEQLEENEGKIREVINQQDSFHEEKVADLY